MGRNLQRCGEISLRDAPGALNLVSPIAACDDDGHADAGVIHREFRYLAEVAHPRRVVLCGE